MCSQLSVKLQGSFLYHIYVHDLCHLGSLVSMLPIKCMFWEMVARGKFCQVKCCCREFLLGEILWQSFELAMV